MVELEEEVVMLVCRRFGKVNQIPKKVEALARVPTTTLVQSNVIPQRQRARAMEVSPRKGS